MTSSPRPSAASPLHGAGGMAGTFDLGRIPVDPSSCSGDHDGTGGVLRQSWVCFSNLSEGRTRVISSSPAPSWRFDPRHRREGGLLRDVVVAGFAMWNMGAAFLVRVILHQALERAG